MWTRRNLSTLLAYNKSLCSKRTGVAKNGSRFPGDSPTISNLNFIISSSSQASRSPLVDVGVIECHDDWS